MRKHVDLEPLLDFVKENAYSEMLEKYDKSDLIEFIGLDEIINQYGTDIIERYGIDKIKNEYDLLDRSEFNEEFQEKFEDRILK